MRRAPLLLMALVACAHTRLAAVPVGSEVQLPLDRGPHDWGQTEWWHVHADLTSPTGEPAQLFAAFVVERTGRDWAGPIPMGPVVNPVHIAMVKIQVGDRSWTSERVAIPDLWAARFVGDGLDLRHGNQRIAWEHHTLLLDIDAGPHHLSLRLDPTREPTLPGDGGVVALTPITRHHWVQEEQMTLQGRWQTRGRVDWVEGVGFYKHQWGTLYDPNIDGFSWFSADLDSERSLVIAQLFPAPDSGEVALAWLRDDQGVRPIHGLVLEPVDWWRSPRSRNRWPIEWNITGPDLSLHVKADHPAQEAWVFPSAIYTGPGRLEGTMEGAHVDAPVFLEQVGVRKPPLRAFVKITPPPERP